MPAQIMSALSHVTPSQMLLGQAHFLRERGMIAEMTGLFSVKI